MSDPVSRLNAALEGRDFPESTPPVPWEADAKTRCFTYVGPQALDLLGFPVEDWHDPAFWTSQIHPDDRSSTIATCTRLSAEGGTYEVTYRMVRSDGGVIWVNDVAAVQMGDAGPITLKGFLIDVSKQKALEAALRDSESFFRRVLYETPDALIRVQTDGTILETNRQAGELFGFSTDELVGSSIERLLPERLAGEHASHRKAFAEDPKARPMGMGRELLALRRDGSEIPVEISLSPIEDGGRRQVLASIRDLTERKAIESELKRRERMLRQMANALPALIAFVDEDKHYRWVNDAYAEWFGVDPNQIVDQPIRDVLGEKLHGKLLPGIETALQGETVHYQMDFPSPTGSTCPVEMSLVPQYGVEGVVSGYFVIVFDISDRVNAQEADHIHREALAHVSRVATIGELTGSIAHELNQPLAAIVTNAQAASRFLAMTTPDLGEVGDALGDIAGDAKRAGEVIRHMRDLLKKGERREDLVDMASLVADTVEMLHSDVIARGVSVVVESEGDLPRLSGDPIQLQQVILNLMMNAFDAVSQRDGELGKLDIKISSSDGSVEITFSDNGPGFSDDIMENAFTPFVSSKPEGLGMGLSISRSIIEAHGGQVLAENNPDGGASLRIILPVDSGEEE